MQRTRVDSPQLYRWRKCETIKSMNTQMKHYVHWHCRVCDNRGSASVIPGSPYQAQIGASRKRHDQHVAGCLEPDIELEAPAISVEVSNHPTGEMIYKADFLPPLSDSQEPEERSIFPDAEDET